MTALDLETRLNRLETVEADRLEKRIKALEQETTSRVYKTLTVLEKLLLPLVLALVTLFAKQTSDRIAEAQVKVAQKNVDVLDGQLKLAGKKLQADLTDAADARRLKYLEFFFHDLNGGDPGRLQNSLALLYSVEPNVARTVTSAIVASPTTELHTREQVSRLALDLGRLGPLINFKLVVYHDAANKTEAQNLVTAIRNLGFTGAIDNLEKPPTYLGDAAQLGYHYRVDEIYELEAGEYLGRLLKLAMPNANFTPVYVVPTGTRTDGVLTIFLFKKSA